MCYFSAFERFRIHIPLFTLAVLLITGSSIMICYGGAKDMNEIWITGIVIGSFAAVTTTFAFFVVCMLFNPNSSYRRREEWKTATASTYPTRLMNPYTQSVVSYPSAMHVQPPIMQMQAIPSPPLASRKDGYLPVGNGSEAPSSQPNSDIGYYKQPPAGQYFSPASSDATFDRNAGIMSPGSMGGGSYPQGSSRLGTMSPTVNVSDKRQLI